MEEEEIFTHLGQLISRHEDYTEIAQLLVSQSLTGKSSLTLVLLLMEGC